MACRTEVQHSRPGQRCGIRLMCSEVERWLVVQELSLLQPERSLPEWHSHLVRWQCDLERMERLLLLAEINWDEDQTFLKVNRCHLVTRSRLRRLSLSCIDRWHETRWWTISANCTLAAALREHFTRLKILSVAYLPLSIANSTRN